MGLSLLKRVSRLPADVREQWLSEQSDLALEEMARGEWWWVARPEQIPPPGDWLVALALAGRGWGKSRAGSEWLTDQIQKHPVDRAGRPTEWLVIGETLADTRTICMDGPAGMLSVLDRRKMPHRYKQSPRPMVLFPDGVKVYAEGADDEDVGRGYNASGCWCVAEGEPVVTLRGLVSIESVQPGDLVATTQGWRRVLRSGLSGKGAQVLRIHTSQGSVAVTGDHRIWANGSWVRADQVHVGDTLSSWSSKMDTQILCHPQPPPSSSGEESPGSTTSGPGTTTTETGCSCIEPSGSASMESSPRATRSITSIEAEVTTPYRTLNFSPSQTIADLLPCNETMMRGRDTRHQRRFATASGPTGNDGNRVQLSAICAAVPSSVPGCEPNAVQTTVDENQPVDTVPVVVLHVEREINPADVFDLVVENVPEFFAGSGRIKIHNCDELAKWPKPYESWYEGILPSLRIDLVDDHPRAFVTTTPKPIKLLIEWLSRSDGTVHVMGGSTFDNADNLSQHVLRELKNRYAGTALGEQELYGKMLDATGGGLFKRMDIYRNRVREVPDELVARVVGVDPNLTGEEAETGIVVVGRDPADEMFVLADHSFPGTGRAAAIHMWRVLAQYRADLLVYETNLGKRWMQEVLQDAYVELRDEERLFPPGTTPPMKGVDSKHGKKTRAEPVAMRNEQGRLHMVCTCGVVDLSQCAEFEELENQMVLFDPESTRDSPDRMDALVHACRYLMAGEKRRMRVSDPGKYDFRLGQELYDLGRLL